MNQRSIVIVILLEPTVNWNIAQHFQNKM